MFSVHSTCRIKIRVRHWGWQDPRYSGGGLHTWLNVAVHTMASFVLLSTDSVN